MRKPRLTLIAAALIAAGGTAAAQDVQVRAGGGSVSIQTNPGPGGIGGSMHAGPQDGSDRHGRNPDAAPGSEPGVRGHLDGGSSVDAQTSPGGQTSKTWEGGRNRTGTAAAPPGGSASTSGASSGPGSGVSSSATSGPGGSRSQTTTR
jgi:hypothetical protein